ncbi:hypothetical protein M9435_000256 [Picochlorum sp. BPE23]|nr:hypothetical protein M9435_000256 [Picochlorum sp. BPE23]
MNRRNTSDLGSLMPNALGGPQGRDSPAGTTEIRQYMNAAYVPNSRRPSIAGGVGRRHSIFDMATPSGKVVSKRLSMSMNKVMNEETPLTMRGPAKKFCIRIKKQHAPTPAALRESQLDPEELKDALLQQAVAQRRSLVNKCLRKGTGRGIKKRKYELKVKVDVPKMRQPEIASSQQAVANSPFTFGPAKELSPMEGVPERLAPSKQVTIQPPVWKAPEGAMDNGSLSPMEGIPEFHALAPPPKKHHSPIRGVMHEAAELTDMPPPPPVAMTHDVNDDYEDLGGGMDYDDYGGPDDMDYGGWNEPLPGRPSVQTIAPKRKRIVLNPGIRLRNELPRKSLAVDITIGRQEIAPGLRRSTRRAQEPLRWWLGEKKQFDRVRHKTMPTISSVMIADPSSPWKTVDDPLGARQDKYKEKKHKMVAKKEDVPKKKTTRRRRAKKPVVKDDASDDDETVLIGSPRKLEADEEGVEQLPAVEEEIVIAKQVEQETADGEKEKVDEEEETLLINQGTPKAVSPTPSQSRRRDSRAHSVDPSDVTVPLVQKNAGSTPASKRMGIIIEADGSCGSADNTDEIAGDEADDDEIIISARAATPQNASKAPGVSETIVLPPVSQQTPPSINKKELPESDGAPEPTLNPPESEKDDGDTVVLGKDDVEKEDKEELLNQGEKAPEEKENVPTMDAEVTSPKKPTGSAKKTPPPPEVTTRRSTRTRNQKKVLDV